MRRWDWLLDKYMEEYQARGFSLASAAYTESRLKGKGRPSTLANQVRGPIFLIWPCGPSPRSGPIVVGAGLALQTAGHDKNAPTHAPGLELSKGKRLINFPN
jgi:hypothetical protein